MLSVAACDSLAKLEGLRPEWDALLAVADPVSIFADWAWVEAAWRYAAPGKAPLVLVVRDGDGALAGLLPLARTRRGRLLGMLEVIGCVPGGYPLGDYGGLIARPGSAPAVWAAVLRYLAARRGWSLIDLRNCPPGPLNSEHYRQAAEAQGWAVRVTPADKCRRLALAPTFPAFLGGLSANTRQQIRRKLRKLQDDGHAILPVDSQDAAARNAALETLFTYHQARWGQDPSGGAFPDEASRALHRHLAGQLAARGQLDLRRVQGADGSTGGVIYNFRQGATTYYYQLGLSPDPPWGAYSLGVCLLADSIAAAIAAGGQTFDLLRGDHEYKQHFGGQVRDNLRVTMYRYRWLPRLEEAGRELRGRLRPRVAAGVNP